MRKKIIFNITAKIQPGRRNVENMRIEAFALHSDGTLPSTTNYLSSQTPTQTTAD
jgi:hypothetical protein